MALLPAATVSSSARSAPKLTSSALVLCAAAALSLTAVPALADDPAPTPSTPVEPTTPVTEPPSTSPMPEPAPNPSAPAQVPLVATSADATPPTVAIGSLGHRLEHARRKGLRFTFALSEPARVRADVLLYGDVTDRELKMAALPAAGPGDSLAKLAVPSAPAGRAAARLPFNVPARRTLRKFLKLTVLVRVIATDAAGNESTAYKRVTLSNL